MIPPHPESRRVDASDQLHGVEILDPFRWLEEETEEVEDWQRAQDEHTRAWLQAHGDGVCLREAVDAIVRSQRPEDLSVAAAGGRLFALRRQPPRPLPFVVVMRPGHDRAQRLPINETKTIDWFVPSPDGRFVAVSVSDGGRESGTLHVLDVDREELVTNPIPRATEATAGGDLVWSEDGSGFLYTRYEEGNRSPSLFEHELGCDWRDDIELQPAEAWAGPVSVRLHRDAERAVAEVVSHRSGDTTVWRRNGQELRRLVEPDARVTEVAIAPDGSIFARIRRQQTDAVARLNGGEPSTVVSGVPLKARLSGSTDSTIVVTSERIFVAARDGIGSKIRAFDHQGRRCASPTAPPSTAVSKLSADGDDLLFRESSFVAHPRWRRFDAQQATTTDVALASRAEADLPGVSVRQETAVAEDGTAIPMTVLLPESAPDPPPCVVYGYGAYGRSLGPSLTVTQQICLQFGVAFAIAHVRGGGELGPRWHEQGRRANKTTTVSDFVTAIQRLKDSGLVDPERIALRGGSFGGVLVTSAMTRVADEIRAVVAASGPYDFLGFEREPNGQFNVDEFGTVDDREEFRTLLALSPYHQVAHVDEPPPVLLLHGEDDARVSIAHARKMLARLQTRDPTGTHLMRVSWATGHSQGTKLDEWAAQNVAIHGFLFHWLQVPFDE